MSAEFTTPKQGQMLDQRFSLGRRLGSCGMASVWVARDERLGRDVAIKLISDTSPQIRTWT